jgi:hypothetical protein
LRVSLMKSVGKCLDPIVFIPSKMNKFLQIS